MAAGRWKGYGVALAVFAADRLTKWLVEARVSLQDDFRIIPGFFSIVHSENRGVAFGIWNDSAAEWRTMALGMLSLVAIGWLTMVLRRPERLDRLTLWGFALILGGAAGNALDRIVWGSVTDFLDFYIGSYHWHTFNLADSGIVIGSGLLLIDLLRPKRQAAHVP